ncbi:hypothetical protein [Amycolatopsis cihanbeyliensis]|nr:hypothetical protein [Amycolatopsis cihanbeyliensis]
MSAGGMAMDLWDPIDQDCEVRCEPVELEIQCSLHVTDHWLNLTFTERGLRSFVAEANRALAELRTAP